MAETLQKNNYLNIYGKTINTDENIVGETLTFRDPYLFNRQILATDNNGTVIPSPIDPYNLYPTSFMNFSNMWRNLPTTLSSDSNQFFGFYTTYIVGDNSFYNISFTMMLNSGTYNIYMLTYCTEFTFAPRVQIGLFGPQAFSATTINQYNDLLRIENVNITISGLHTVLLQIPKNLGCTQFFLIPT